MALGSGDGPGTAARRADSGAHERAADAPPDSGKAGRWSDLGARAFTIAIAVPVVVALVWWAPAGAWAAVVALVAFAAAWECMTLLTRGTRPVAAQAGAILSAGVAVGLYVAGGADPGTMVLRLLLTLGAAMLVLAVMRASLRSPRAQALASLLLAVVFTAAYCGLLPAHLALLRRDEGRAWLLLALAVAWGGDVAAYVAGKAWGGPRIAPAISPAKTVVGAFAGLLLALAAGVAYAMLARHGGRLVAVVVIAGALSQVGDLGESLLKRRCGAKDSGRTIPGHGGFLDCIDGLALAAPWLYYAHHHLS